MPAVLVRQCAVHTHGIHGKMAGQHYPNTAWVCCRKRSVSEEWTTFLMSLPSMWRTSRSV